MQSSKSAFLTQRNSVLASQEHDTHNRKLYVIQSKPVMYKIPRLHTHIKINLKKEQMDRERHTKIVKDNHYLMRKLQSIENRSNNYTDRKHMQPKLQIFSKFLQRKIDWGPIKYNPPTDIVKDECKSNIIRSISQGALVTKKSLSSRGSPRATITQGRRMSPSLTPRIGIHINKSMGQLRTPSHRATPKGYKSQSHSTQAAPHIIPMFGSNPPPPISHHSVCSLNSVNQLNNVGQVNTCRPVVVQHNPKFHVSKWKAFPVAGRGVSNISNRGVNQQGGKEMNNRGVFTPEGEIGIVNDNRPIQWKYNSNCNTHSLIYPSFPYNYNYNGNHQYAPFPAHPVYNNPNNYKNLGIKYNNIRSVPGSPPDFEHLIVKKEGGFAYNVLSERMGTNSVNEPLVLDTSAELLDTSSDDN